MHSSAAVSFTDSPTGNRLTIACQARRTLLRQCFAPLLAGYPAEFEATPLLGRVTGRSAPGPLISLTGCPADLGEQVTRATNTQNAVHARDFVALDDLQTRLRQDFALRLAKLYVIKRGEDEPTGEDGCSVVEAADALACAYEDPSYAVTAKGNRGQLLETSGEHYKRLFHRELTAPDVWDSVRVLRAVDAELERRQSGLVGRERTVAKQGNRLVAHLVFDSLRRAEPGGEDVVQVVPGLVQQVLPLLIRHVENHFPDSYVTSLFKNVTKCRQLASSVQAETLTANRR